MSQDARLMRSYFFHLQFEVCSATLADLISRSQQLPDAAADIDIFAAALPQHSVLPWGETLDDQNSKKRRKSDPWNQRSPTHGTDAAAGSQWASALPHHVKGTADAASAPRDWRYDRIAVVSIDMAAPSQQRPRYGRGKSMSQETPAEIVPGAVATKGQYVPTSPSNAELGWGIVHLYRDAQETPGLYDEANRAEVPGNSRSAAPGAAFDVGTCSTLCILAVPSYMSPSDLLGYVGEQTREEVSHFRLIRTGRANKYMVLMKFRQAKQARQWQKTWNGKPFNTMEPEYCHVVFVESITFQVSDRAEKPTSFPNMNNDPFLPVAQQTAHGTSADAALGNALTTKPMAPPTPALIELPTCPVCLERMDETTGLLIILCQHVFHCACLEKWRGTGCPVCRYTQSNGMPGFGRGLLSGEDGTTTCSTCQSEQNLWICLICGNIGCGRYDSAHAFAHWEETKHSYAMDIGTQHVWDYAGDGYVHRLIQNKADGKLMDLPAASDGNKLVDHGMSAFGADMVPRDKMDAMSNEYTYLLTSQLDSQRLYYEEQLDRAVDKASQTAAAADKTHATLQSLMAKLDSLQSSHEALQTQFHALEKEAARAKARADKTDALARKLSHDWKEEKTVNDSLLERIKFLDARVADEQAKRLALEADKADLEDQNRDLTFFISSAEKLKEAGEDVVQGTVEVPVTEAPSSSGNKKARKKKR